MGTGIAIMDHLIHAIMDHLIHMVGGLIGIFMECVLNDYYYMAQS